MVKRNRPVLLGSGGYSAALVLAIFAIAAAVALIVSFVDDPMWGKIAMVAGK